MRHLLMLTILWTISLTLTAQTDYPFIQYDKNHLVYDTESPYMQRFAHKWQRVVENHQGSLNIVHIGSSHVQGGTFPNAVRCNLLTYLPDLVGDRGMIFPYSAARMCNNPHDYRVHCPEPVTLTRCVSANPAYNLGLCGIAVTAHDVTTHIQIALQSHINYSTTQVIVIGYSRQNVVPLLSIAGRQVPPSYVDPDSRRYIYNLASTIDSIQIVIPCQQGEQFTLQGIYLSNHYPGISYHSIGVNGASLLDYLKCEQWVDDLRLLHPDMVVFGIGINDASGPNFDTAIFRSRYLRLIDSVRTVNPDCAFVFITNNDSYKAVRGRKRRRHYVVNPNGAEARKVFYRLANETQGAVWDQFEIMGGLGSMDQWCKARLAQRDHVHFTIGGYQILGSMLGDAIIEAANCPVSNHTIKHNHSNKAKGVNAPHTTTPTATTTHPVQHKEPMAPFVRY